eukprot:CAMPEP_0194486466 /NCGR_PEP_ID=MMETSP0253-20130528/7105_1 /TAXON_ID=2966 /ORGANISM="Noctiluca scintillans" /LENGTH=204 /DNA_ID=CAMNT_0039326557 /DNA_START=91 /DNA_END=705 /DNA_ORIENTATION=-
MFSAWMCVYVLMFTRYVPVDAKRMEVLDRGMMTTEVVAKHEQWHPRLLLHETHQAKLRSHAQDATWHDSFLQQAEGIRTTLAGLVEMPTKLRAKEALVIFEVLGLGVLGIDRMYLGGRWGVLLGMAKLLSCGGCGIWALADFVAVLSNALREEDKIDVLGMEGEFDRAGLQSARWIAIGAIVFISFFLCILGCMRGKHSVLEEV